MATPPRKSSGAQGSDSTPPPVRPPLPEVDGLALKQRGNTAFGAGRLAEAVALYAEAATRLTKLEDASELSKVWANTAECHLLLKAWPAAEAAATSALCADDGNHKARFRRARARLERDDLSGAADDARRVSADAPGSMGAEGRKLLQVIQDRQHQSSARGFFGAAAGRCFASAVADPRSLSSGSRVLFPDGLDRQGCFRRLIDSYRLSVEDEYTMTGDVDERSLYGGTAVPLPHFRSYIRKAERRDAVPGWWVSDRDTAALCEMATSDAFSNIKFAAEKSDMVEHYTALSKPTEHLVLRALAEMIRGQGASFGSGLGDDGSDYDDDSDEFGDYNEYDDDAEDSFYEDDDYDDNVEYGMEDFSWLWTAPYSPSWDPQSLQAFQRKFKTSPPFARMDLTFTLRGGYGRPDHDDKTRMILEKRFGRAKNGLTAEEFARAIEIFEVLSLSLKEQMGMRSLEGIPSDPSQWQFDHYGPLCALAHAAFATMPAESQESADIQARLVEVTLGGFERTLTEHLVGADSSRTVRWVGFVAGLHTMPNSWGKGNGAALMKRAWEIWTSTADARAIADEAQAMHAVGDMKSVRAACSRAFDLLCFAKPVISIASRRQQIHNSVGWDSVGDLTELHTGLVLLAGEAHLALGDPASALEAVEEPAKHLQWGCGTRENKSRPALVRLRLVKGKALAALGRYRDARNELGGFLGLLSNIKTEREMSGAATVLGVEEAEAKEVLKSLEGRRGPLPVVVPVPNELNPGWLTFDATCTKEAQDALLEDENLNIRTWQLQRCPYLLNLHVKIQGGSGIGGLADAFPDLQSLVVDDADECIRIMYDLAPVLELAPTLIHLELRLSNQWMCEGEDVLAPLASLTSLRRLHISRLRDGFAKTLKAFETLVALEDLFYEGANETYLDEGEYDDRGNFVASPPRKTPPPPEAILDLSRLQRLKRLVFVEASFCAASEGCHQLQVLLLPPQLSELTCVPVYDSACTDTLVAELSARGVTLHRRAPPKNRGEATASKEFWNGVLALTGPWFRLKDAGVEEVPCVSLNVRPR